ncbi:MAG TPA: metallophosphoesterase family protein [Actinomycetota bacterium]|nr:metallophosphoesterase family protein [Actinomycetota bacterium]
MAVAALYDIHGNLPALEAVLTEIDALGVDAVVVGGDVLWGPMSVEALDVLLGLDPDTFFIRGNADREVVDGTNTDDWTGGEDWIAEVTRWCADQMTRDQREIVAAWPETVRLEAAGAFFCHGSPRSDEEKITTATGDDELGTMLTGVIDPLVVCGHTHMQFDRRVGEQRVVNAGSVGMPYEGRRGAFWALIDHDVELRRTDYDFDTTAAMILRSECPSAEEFARAVLAPLSREAALEAFSG